MPRVQEGRARLSVLRLLHGKSYLIWACDQRACSVVRAQPNERSVVANTPARQTVPL